MPMPDASVPAPASGQTSTDDVRRVGGELYRRFHGDIGKLCARAQSQRPIHPKTAPQAYADFGATVTCA